jgi:hypothetical protein
MAFRRIALIGHPSSGKTSCLQKLGINPDEGKMENALSNAQRPQISSLVEWLSGTETDLSIVSISNQHAFIDDLCRKKLNGELADLFTSVFFVYLHKSKERLKQHLLLPLAEGDWRSASDQKYALKTYEHCYEQYQLLANDVIDCNTDGLNKIAEQVQQVIDRS